eukprot:CAMPEP_0179111632 /NCGR_PEP_ID=MMETSP0796-20121207/52147_1 /TAXON_ID=73915 /ORGANISM="Pyrodinium bahamense, Strain pbaha01" /LENGTH=301 /DNA_ID=CAMNT_0020809783 /DNA_START=87 /DNA_END=994 /DNA_ORIENTATION=-
MAELDHLLSAAPLLLTGTAQKVAFAALRISNPKHFAALPTHFLSLHVQEQNAACVACNWQGAGSGEASSSSKACMSVAYSESQRESSHTWASAADSDARNETLLPVRSVLQLFCRRNGSETSVARLHLLPLRRGLAEVVIPATTPRTLLSAPVVWRLLRKSSACVLAFAVALLLRMSCGKEGGGLTGALATGGAATASGGTDGRRAGCIGGGRAGDGSAGGLVARAMAAPALPVAFGGNVLAAAFGAASVVTCLLDRATEPMQNSHMRLPGKAFLCAAAAASVASLPPICNNTAAPPGCLL